MNKYKIGTFVIILLTLMLTGLVYRLGYGVYADEKSLQTFVEQTIAADEQFSDLSNEASVLRWEVLKGRLLVFFTLRHHPDYQGLAILEKGFNQAYRPSKLVLQNQEPIAYEFVYTGGLDHLVLYSNQIPDEVQSMLVMQSGRWEVLVDKVQAKSFLYAISGSKMEKFLRLVRHDGYLPQILGYSASGEVLFDSDATFSGYTTVPQRFVKEMSIPVNGWVLVILLVGISLAIYLWQESIHVEEEKKQTRESKILSSLLQKSQATAPEGVRIY